MGGKSSKLSSRKSRTMRPLKVSKTVTKSKGRDLTKVLDDKEKEEKEE